MADLADAARAFLDVVDTGVSLGASELQEARSELVDALVGVPVVEAPEPVVEAVDPPVVSDVPPVDGGEA